jgi:hypothetical protein
MCFFWVRLWFCVYHLPGIDHEFTNI